MGFRKRGMERSGGEVTDSPYRRWFIEEMRDMCHCISRNIENYHTSQLLALQAVCAATVEEIKQELAARKPKRKV